MEQTGRYGGDTQLLEYIYGITHEIWEQRGVDLIRQYYADDIRMFALSGVSDGAEAVVEGTRATLAAFPDRLLLAENVIWSRDEDGDYSSHRIMSPMTNLGDSRYGPATGKKVYVRTIADCLVQNGVITREWLVRDTLPLVVQLGLDPLAVARNLAQDADAVTRAWIDEELARSQGLSRHDRASWARDALAALWREEAEASQADHYPHYVVRHPDPLNVISGLDGLRDHARGLRASFGVRAVKVDHVAEQPWGHEGFEVAVRWTLNGTHHGDYQGLPATGRDVFILGSSHWRVINGKVATDWTVFDGMGVLAQLI